MKLYAVLIIVLVPTSYSGSEELKAFLELRKQWDIQDVPESPGSQRENIGVPLAAAGILVCILLMLAFARFSTFGRTSNAAQLGDKEIDDMFNEIDADSSGAASQDEVRSFMKRLDAAIPENQVTALMHIADTDGSGDLDRNEFRILLSNLGGEEPQEFTRAICAEAIGTFMFQFFGGMPQAGPLGNALVVTALIYVFAPISGAHLNPAVTVAVLTSRQITMKKALWYVVIHVLAAIEGCLMLQLLGVEQFSNTSGRPIIPCTHHRTGMAASQVFFIELICTFMFITVILAVAIDPKSGWGNISPLIIGVATYGVCICCSTESGVSMNPARYLAPVIVYGCSPSPSDALAYVLAALLGAALAAQAYKILFMERPTPELRAGIANFQFMATSFRKARKQLYTAKSTV